MKFSKKMIVPAAVFIFAVIAVFFGIKILSLPASDAQTASGYELTITGQTTTKELAADLKQHGIIKSPQLFYLYVRFPKIASILTSKPESTFKVKKGWCSFNSSMNLVQVFEEVSAGKPQMVKVVIPEGFTLLKVARKLEESGVCSAKAFMKVALDQADEILGDCSYYQSAVSLEGFLYPETYYFVKNSSASEAASLMVKTFFQKIASISNNPLKQPQELYSQLILASIIEREYQDSEEAPLIASVFKNRLKRKMPLQSCATVEYIITEIQHKPHPNRLFYSDLEIQNPYNTYANSGLPPGPICSPGFTALNAVFNSADTDYLYFTLTDSDNGRHTFSKNFNDHNKATVDFRLKKAAGY